MSVAGQGGHALIRLGSLDGAEDELRASVLALDCPRIP